MEEIALARINSFASPAPTADFIQALLAELSALREEVAQLQEDNLDIREKIADLEMDRDLAADRDLNQLKLINNLREMIQPEPQPMQKDRGDVLRALLAANDGKMLAKDARKKMHLSKQAFTNLLATMGDYIVSKHYHLDKRQKVLLLR